MAIQIFTRNPKNIGAMSIPSDHVLVTTKANAVRRRCFSITGPVNIGNPTEFSVLELANMVIDLVGSRSRIVHRPLPENDPKQRRPDISRAQELLNWKPYTALKEGLVSTIAYFERLLREHYEPSSKVRRR